MLHLILQSITNGILIGSVYGLISVGLTLMFGVMNIVNFAQGEYLMIGMMLAYLLSTALKLDPLIIAPLVGVLGFLFGMLSERLVIEPIIKAPQSAQIIATVGLSLILANGVAVITGNNFLSVTTPYQNETFDIFGLTFSASFVYAAICALIMATLLSLFLNKTRYGKAMRATSQNRSAVQLMGINPRWMYMLAFGIGSALTMIAGAVILPYTLTYPYIGQHFILIMFTVVVLGGLGSVRGAIVAGLVVGVIQSASTLVLPIEIQNLPVFIVFFFALVLIPGGVLKRLQRGRLNHD
ncbi:MAG TPA: branched-chain amino acid ABC transporter permease [Castellaniella sp.]|uniref:branched-chain amino acid ABC transporter permease n=1 Tax=Castellaniella sp. TaxID=1955812 RepID=UPI002EE0232D